MKIINFLYASPPAMGEGWYHLLFEKIYDKKFLLEDFTDPFDSDENGLLKLTTVRNPCDWLRSYFNSWYKNHLITGIPVVDEFLQEPDLKWDDFIQMYIHKLPGSVTSIYNLYHADSVMRLEDQPWALCMLLETFQVPKLRYNFIKFTNAPRNFYNWDPKVKQKVKNLESEIVEAYDY